MVPNTHSLAPAPTPIGLEKHLLMVIWLRRGRHCPKRSPGPAACSVAETWPEGTHLCRRDPDPCLHRLRKPHVLERTLQKVPVSFQSLSGTRKSARGEMSCRWRGGVKGGSHTCPLCEVPHICVEKLELSRCFPDTKIGTQPHRPLHRELGE